MPISTKNAKNAKIGMSHHDILANIKKQNSSYSSIAKHFDIEPTSVRSVATGKTDSHRIAIYISQLINIPLDDIWPDRYTYTPRPSFKERCDNAATA